MQVNTQTQTQEPISPPARRVALTSPRKVRAQTRKLKALEYRQSGESYDAIAEKLGMSREGARKAVVRALEEMNAEVQDKVQEMKNEMRLELLRLDEMQDAIWDKAVSGDIPCQQQMLRIIEHRAKLLGLDKAAGQLDAKEEDAPRSMVHVYIPDNGRDAIECEPSDRAQNDE